MFDSLLKKIKKHCSIENVIAEVRALHEKMKYSRTFNICIVSSSALSMVYFLINEEWVYAGIYLILVLWGLCYVATATRD
jgi:hypothetical protein